MLSDLLPCSRGSFPLRRTTSPFFQALQTGASCYCKNKTFRQTRLFDWKKILLLLKFSQKICRWNISIFNLSRIVKVAYGGMDKALLQTPIGIA
jgi:hypothetical protein